MHLISNFPLLTFHLAPLCIFRSMFSCKLWPAYLVRFYKHLCPIKSSVPVFSQTYTNLIIC